jgi:hypothetical protein
MGARQDFRLLHVHAHVNLLGWLALGHIGLLYMCRPQLQHGWMPHAHFWRHTVGLVAFMGGFAWSRLGDTFHKAPVAGGALNGGPWGPAVRRARLAARGVHDAGPGLALALAVRFTLDGLLVAGGHRVLETLFGVRAAQRGTPGNGALARRPTVLITDSCRPPARRTSHLKHGHAHP